MTLNANYINGQYGHDSGYDEKNCNKNHFSDGGITIESEEKTSSNFENTDTHTSMQGCLIGARRFEEKVISFFQPSDNKLAMKLYGNKNALDKEKVRQSTTTRWIIHPCSDFRSVLEEDGLPPPPP